MPQTIVRERGEGPRFTKTLRVEGLQFKFDDSTGEVEGFAAVMGHPDSYEEIIDNGAFKKTLREKKGRIALAWQHNFREPIGKPTVLREVKREKLPEGIRAAYPKASGGLYFKATISDTRQGRDAKTLLRDGVVDEVSIGYDFFWMGDWEEGWETDGYYEGDDGYIHLREIDLYEFSLVTMAAHPAAQVVGFKSVGEALESDPLRRSLSEIVLGPHKDLDPEPEPATMIDPRHLDIIELIQKGEFQEAHERLQLLMAELSLEEAPVVLGLAGELNLRSMVLELGLDLEGL